MKNYGMIIKSYLISVLLIICSFNVFSDVIDDAVRAYRTEQYETSFKLFNDHLKLDLTNSNLYLGLMYRYGHYVERDFSKAKSYFEEAERHGSTLAKQELALMYFDGIGVQKNHKKAVEYFRGHDKALYPDVYFLLAMKLFDSAATSRNQKEVEDGLFFLRHAAEEGHAESAYQLALLYEDGGLVEKSEGNAFFYYKIAAESGSAIAQYNLARVYFNGLLSVPKCIEKSIFWYEKAANSNVVEAQYMLGVIYYQGDEVEQDLKQAHQWINRALNNNYEHANDVLQLVVDAMKNKKDRK